MWEGVGDRTELQHIDPHSSGHNSVSFMCCLTGGLGAHSVVCWLSLPHLLSNWLNFLCTELYNSSTPTFLWASQIALIQPVHGQGYILIFLDRMHQLFTQVHFLFWQPGRVGGQYTTHLLFCYVLSILALIWLVLMALFCAAIRRDSVSLIKFPFLSQVQVFWCEMLFIRL